MKKLHYATRLSPLSANKNRVFLLRKDTGMSVIDGHRSYFNIDIERLPFTAAIRKAHAVVNDGSEFDYFNIGRRPDEVFALSDSDILHLNYTLFLFAMRRAMSRHLWSRSLPNYFASYVREDVMSGTYVHKLKMVTLRLLLQEVNPRLELGRVIAEYKAEGFPYECARLYQLYWNSGEGLHTVKQLAELREPFVLEFGALMDEANSVVEETNLRSLAQYQASRRLSFIADSNRYDTDDLAAELVTRSRVVYTHCRPFLSQMHSTNYARAMISTYALRMLKHYQSEERSRMLTLPDGSNTNRFVAIDDSHTPHREVENELIAQIDARRDRDGLW